MRVYDSLILLFYILVAAIILVSEDVNLGKTVIFLVFPILFTLLILFADVVLLNLSD
jgi:hypothetical protein